MIRLTLKSNSVPEIHLFNKSIILIGSDASQVDLVLSNSTLLPIHLKIIEQSGQLWALNEANDPFVSINHHPFGKKLLKNEDVIQIDQEEILLEILKEDPFASEPELPLESLNAPGSKVLKKHSFLNVELPFDEEIEMLNEGDIKSDHLQEILGETVTTEKLAADPFFSTKNSVDSIEKRRKSSLKDDYLRDLEDDNKPKSNPFQINDSSHLYQAWKWILVFIFSTCAIVGLLGIVLFYSLSDKTGVQETKAAQAVSDIAMALTHAQLYHLKPHNQNWSDVEFLKNNIQAILPNSNSYASQIDGQGQLNCCPYSLRIYTNTDLSRFLLIAQPAPSLFYWLVPKSVIVLDSESMELRTFTDVRGINRALANSDPLDGVNGKETGNLVKKGKLIRLSVLANESNNPDLAPPKNIAWIKPGAENYIYNAPRYFRMGQVLLQKAINLSTSKGTGQEVAALKQDVASFSRLNHLVLYAENKKTASISKHSLMLFAPSDKFLFGYLVQNNQGNIHEVHLLKEENEDSSFMEDHRNLDEVLAYQSTLSEPHEMGNRDDFKEKSVDFEHPIYIQLHALIVTRENELRPLSAAIFNLLSQELEAPKAHFQTEFQNLYHTYLITNSRHKQNIKDSIMLLYRQYEDMPIDQFMTFLNKLHLNHLILQKDQTLSLIDENCIQNLENIFTNIRKCNSLIELDNLVHMAIVWLNFDYLKDPQELIKYQNLLRNFILEQLDAFLLSGKKSILIKQEDKEPLKHILDHERLIKSDEKEYFLAEFNESFVVQNQAKDQMTRNENSI